MQAVKEAVKELLRVILIAVIPVAIDGLSSGELSLRAVLIVGIIAGLRGIDKLLHEREAAKPEEDQNRGLLGLKGITGF